MKKYEMNGNEFFSWNKSHNANLQDSDKRHCILAMARCQASDFVFVLVDGRKEKFKFNVRCEYENYLKNEA